MVITVLTTLKIFQVFLGMDNKMGRNHERAYRVIKLLLFVCVTFVISYLVLVISSFYNTFIGTTPVALRATVIYFLSINVISNPFIYVIISPHFRGYMTACVRRVRGPCCRGRVSVEPTCTQVKYHDSERHSTLGKSEGMVARNVSQE